MKPIAVSDSHFTDIVTEFVEFLQHFFLSPRTTTGREEGKELEKQGMVCRRDSVWRLGY
jgi:hypothetical protein